MYKLEDLPYDYDALEPVISAEIMEIHHQKHHAGYIKNLNEALEKYHAAKDLRTMLALLKDIKFNGGGHHNHMLFWKSLSPQKQEISKNFLTAIEKDFGSFEKMQGIFNKKTIGVKGSGWGWLGYNKEEGKLVISYTSNHDTIGEIGLVPLMVVDVWEHAYYLQYKNDRRLFVESLWGILNWSEIEKNYLEARK